MPRKAKTCHKKPVLNPFRELKQSPNRSDYGTLHRKLRQQKLDLEIFCQHCKEAFATEANHLVYPARSIDDYEALCHDCHVKETNRQLGRG